MEQSQNQSDETAQTPAPRKEGPLDLQTLDWPEVRLALLVIIDAQKAAPKTRERALVITKLEEARMWAGEAMMTE